MKQKKNKFFTFLFSFLPGAAEMYMGFMKCGLSLMGLFFLSIMIPALFSLSDVFAFVIVLIWFYSFFHARSFATCSETDFLSLSDEFIWESFLSDKKIAIPNPILRKWAAGILILCGILMIWKNVSSFLYLLIPESLWEELSLLVDLIPQIAIAIIIIALGIKLIMGKKEELNGNEGK